MGLVRRLWLTFFKGVYLPVSPWVFLPYRPHPDFHPLLSEGAGGCRRVFLLSEAEPFSKTVGHWYY